MRASLLAAGSAKAPRRKGFYLRDDKPLLRIQRNPRNGDLNPSKGCPICNFEWTQKTLTAPGQTGTGRNGAVTTRCSIEAPYDTSSPMWLVLTLVAAGVVMGLFAGLFGVG